MANSFSKFSHKDFNLYNFSSKEIFVGISDSLELVESEMIEKTIECEEWIFLGNLLRNECRKIENDYECVYIGIYIPNEKSWDLSYKMKLNPSEVSSVYLEDA